MKTLRCIFVVVLSAWACMVHAQDYEQLAQQCFSSGDVYAMKELLDSHGEQLSPIANALLKTVTGFAFNKNEQAVESVMEIMNNYQDELDGPTIFNLVYLAGRSCDVMGRYKDNVAMMGSFLQSVKGVDGIPAEAYVGHERIYNTSLALSQCPPMTVERGENGVFPFRRDTVGPKRNVSLRVETAINGKYNNSVLDTGSAYCVITPRAAEHYGLKPIDTQLMVTAARTETAQYALADELVMGDLTLRNVLFVVMDFKAGHPEADQYLNFDVIIGLNAMAAMGEIDIDFEKDRVVVPSEPMTTGPCNLTRSLNSMTFYLRAWHDDEPMGLLVDTGNSDYAYLGADYYTSHKEWIEANADTVTFRQAGLNGVIIGTKYKLRNYKLRMGESTVSIPEMMVASSGDTEHIEENNMGLPTMALFKRVNINFRDAYMKFEE